MEEEWIGGWEQKGDWGERPGERRGNWPGYKLFKKWREKNPAFLITEKTFSICLSEPGLCLT